MSLVTVCARGLTMGSVSDLVEHVARRSVISQISKIIIGFITIIVTHLYLLFAERGVSKKG